VFRSAVVWLRAGLMRESDRNPDAVPKEQCASDLLLQLYSDHVDGLQPGSRCVLIEEPPIRGPFDLLLRTFIEVQRLRSMYERMEFVGVPIPTCMEYAACNYCWDFPGSPDP